MKQLLLIIYMVLGAVRMNAAEPWLKRPLTFVSPDSVMIWDYAGENYAQRVVSRDSTVRTPRFAVTPELVELREKVSALCTQLAANLNIVGGGDDERTQPQGVPGMMNMSANAYMFLLTGKAAYMDHVERSFYNALLETSERTDLPFRQPDRHGAFESLMAIGGTVYATEGNDLYINLYTNSTASITLRDAHFSLDQITSMPSSGKVRFRITKLKQPTKFRIHLRMPDWAVHRKPLGTNYAYADTASTLPHIFVSGFEADDAKMDADGYVVIERTWQRLDEVYFELPLTPQYLCESATDGTSLKRGKVAVQCGPLVYATGGNLNGCYFSRNTPPVATGGVTESGMPILDVTLYRAEGTPADAAAPAVTFQATPYCDNTDSVGTVWLNEPR